VIRPSCGHSFSTTLRSASFGHGSRSFGEDQADCYLYDDHNVRIVIDGTEGQEIWTDGSRLEDGCAVALYHPEHDAWTGVQVHMGKKQEVYDATPFTVSRGQKIGKRASDTRS